MIGEYAAWFGRAGSLPAAVTAASAPVTAAAMGGASSGNTGTGPQPPLEPALNLLLVALPVPEAQRGAAQAFRNVCIRCCNLLSSPATLRGAWCLNYHVLLCVCVMVCCIYVVVLAVPGCFPC